MIKYFIYILFIFFYSFPLQTNKGFQFYKETIDFEIDKFGFFKVSGIYYFSNTENKKLSRPILYPFPTGKEFGEIDSLIINCNVENAISSIKQNKQGALFLLTIDKYSALKVDISYRQKIINNRAEYILTTTQKWNKALETADYSLTIPSDLIIDSLSYNAHNQTLQNEEQKYFWSFKDFMPSKNFTVTLNQK